MDYIVLFILIVMSSCFFRFYQIGRESLWIDEATSITMSWGTLSDLIKFALEEDKASPGFNFIIHFWMKMVGVSEGAVRSLSALTGVMSVIGIIILTKKLLDIHTALLAGLLASSSEVYIWYSQEARTYSIYLFLSIISFYLFEKLLNHNNRSWRYTGVLYSFITAAMFYFHYYGILLLFSQTLVLFFWYLQHGRQKNQLFRILVFQAGAFSLFSPWLIIFYNQVKLIAQYQLIKGPDLFSVWYVIKKYSMGNTPVSVIFLLLTILGSFVLIKNRQTTMFLLSWLLTSPLIALVYSLSRNPIFADRYLIGASPPFFIIIAIGISFILKRFFHYKGEISSLYVGIVCLILVISAWFYLEQHYYNRMTKIDWKGAII